MREKESDASGGGQLAIMFGSALIIIESLDVCIEQIENNRIFEHSFECRLRSRVTSVFDRSHHRKFYS